MDLRSHPRKLPNISNTKSPSQDHHHDNDFKVITTATVIYFRGCPLPVRQRQTEERHRQPNREVSSAYPGHNAWIQHSQTPAQNQERHGANFEDSKGCQMLSVDHGRIHNSARGTQDLLLNNIGTQPCKILSMGSNVKQEYPTQVTQQWTKQDWIKYQLKRLNITETINGIHGKSLQKGLKSVIGNTVNSPKSEQDHYQKGLNGNLSQQHDVNDLKAFYNQDILYNETHDLTIHSGNDQHDKNIPHSGVSASIQGGGQINHRDSPRPTSAIHMTSPNFGTMERRATIHVAGPSALPVSEEGKTCLWAGMNKIDMNTVRWRSWMGDPSNISFATSADSVAANDDEDDTDTVPESTEALYKVTQKEFQRLTDQLHTRARGFSPSDVNKSSITGQYKTYQGGTTPGVLSQQLYIVDPTALPPRDNHGTTAIVTDRFQREKKEHSQGRNPDTQNSIFDSDVDLTPIVERSQIAQSLRASIKAFQDRKWLPYHPTFDLPETVEIPKRPATSSIADIRRPLASKSGIPPVPPRKPRQRSAPVRKGLASQKNVESQHNDSVTALTDAIVIDHEQVEENDLCNGQSRQVELRQFEDQLTQTEIQVGENVRDTEPSGYPLPTEDEKPPQIFSIEDLFDDEEEGPEPSIENINIDSIPKLDLRPEKLDDLPLEYADDDLKRFNFDATTIDMPLYQFKAALPEEFMGINFREAARRDKNWRELTKHRPDAPNDTAILDRIQQLEKLQRMTELAESQRKGIRISSARYRVRSASAAGTSQRQILKLTKDAVPKKCTDCAKSDCMGDCQFKSGAEKLHSTCVICQKTGCSGTCGAEIYDVHSRLDSRLGGRDESQKVLLQGQNGLFKPTTSRGPNNSLLNRPKSSLGIINHQNVIRPVSRAKTPMPGTSKLEYTLNSITLDVPESEDSAKPKCFGLPGHNSNSSRSYFKVSPYYNNPIDVNDVKESLKNNRQKSAKKRPKTALS